jgi:hypothetical protein
MRPQELLQNLLSVPMPVNVFHEASQQIDQAGHLNGEWAMFKHPHSPVEWYVDGAVSGVKSRSGPR